MARLTQADEHAANELELYAMNDGDIYHRSFMPAVKNLNAKFKKGTYDREKAIKLMGYVAEFAAKRYEKEFLNRGEWSKVFNAATRRLAARGFVSVYEAEYRNR